MRALASASEVGGIATRATPWTLGDLARLIRFTATSLVVIVVCFAGARHTDDWDLQLYWVVGAMAAMLLAGAGWTAWLVAGTRALRQRQRHVLEVTALLTAPGPGIAAELTVTAAGMTRFHRPGCPLTAGRAVEPAPAEDQRARGLTPCGVCLG